MVTDTCKYQNTQLPSAARLELARSKPQHHDPVIAGLLSRTILVTIVAFVVAWAIAPSTWYEDFWSLQSSRARLENPVSNQLSVHS